MSRATIPARRYVWRYIRLDRRWPTLEEWRFLILGRWPNM
jgi:hypothetical protein